MKHFVLGDSVALALPDSLDTRDDDGTLVAYPPGTDFANLRISMSTILHSGAPAAGMGASFIARQAREKRLHLQRYKHLIWYRSSKRASEGPPGSRILFWFVELGAHMLVVSLYLNATTSSDPRTTRVRRAVTSILRSFEEIGAA